MDAKTKTLLKIVKTWNLSKKPEYRGFRCANCQKYMRKAWHYWLNEGGYKTPVHFCSKCKINLKLPGANYRKFNCDKCSKNVRKAYHIWNKKEGVLSEIHFCKKCGDKLKLVDEAKASSSSSLRLGGEGGAR